MSYDSQDNHDDKDALDYDNAFGELLSENQNKIRRNAAINPADEYKPRTRRKSDIVYGGGAVRYRNDDLQSHYTPRDPARKKRRVSQMNRRSGSSSNSRHVQAVGKKRTDAKNSSVRRSQNTVRQTSTRTKTKYQLSRSTVVVGTVCLLIVIFVLTSMVVNSLYFSKSLFSDEDDDLTIQERLITAEENQDKVTYLLIVGVDKSSMLTDCIWLMCFDNQAHKMNVMQIPRDTYVGSDSLYPYKINAVYENPQTVTWCNKCNCVVEDDEVYNSAHVVCGQRVTEKTESNISALIRCINTRLSLPVDHYVLFDFDGFEKVIDAMGGVDITLDEDLRVYPNKHEYEVLPAGENHLDGETALKFMRNRQAYTEGDLGRVKAQRKIVQAMLEKVMDMSAIKVFSLLSSAYGNFSTDMSLEEIRSFISPIKKCGTDSLYMFEMPGESHWVKPNPSYYVCNEEETLEMINEYLLPYGDKLTAEDINFPVPIP